MEKFGKEGCFVKIKGSRNKHVVKSIEHIGNYMPDMVLVIELCSKQEKATIWKNIKPWKD